MTSSETSPETKRTLRSLREERGVTRERLAADLEISFNTLSNLESGRNKPSIDIAEKLYAYFGVPLGKIDWDTPVEEYKRTHKPKNAFRGNAESAEE